MNTQGCSGIDLREAVRLLERKLGVLGDLQASCCGVTFAQCHVIVETGRAGSISLNDLAAILDLDKSTMSRTVQSLVVKGLIRRDTDQSDRRFITLTLTDQGRKEFLSIEKTMNGYFDAVCGRIAPESRGVVVESLRLFLDAITGTPCCTEPAPEKENQS